MAICPGLSRSTEVTTLGFLDAERFLTRTFYIATVAS